MAISPDRGQDPAELATVLNALIDGGISAFMFREKKLDDPAFVSCARSLRALCDQRDVAFILNERHHLREPVGADIVHLTWQSAPLARSSDDGLIVGRSVHDLTETRQALDEGVDYLIAGPVWDTASKRGLVEVMGLDGLGAVCAAAGCPVIAIGGLRGDRASAARRSGAAGVAAISAFFDEADVEAAAQSFLKGWGE